MDLTFDISSVADMLRGSQDHNLFMLEGFVILTCGFCTSLDGVQTPPSLRNKTNKKTSFERGFIKDIFCYSIKNDSWKIIGQLPFRTRQRCLSITLYDKMYMWGGFSYTPLTSNELLKHKKEKLTLPSKNNIFCYFDGIYISYINDKLNHAVAPHLPYSLHSAGVVKSEKYKKVYFLNGATYDRKSFNTFHKNDNIFVGCSFFSMSYDDTGILQNSIEFINTFPGSPRHSAITHIIDDVIYVIGGNNSTQYKINSLKGYSEYTYNNVIDNWKYDISTKKWHKLRDLPIPICNQGNVIYKNRYILLMGGVKYNTTYLTGGRVVKSDDIPYQRNFPYNNISTIQNPFKTKESGASQFNWYFSNLIMVYDTFIDKYITLDNKLPMNINNPKMIVYKNDIYIMGGEGNPILYNGTYYGNCLSLVLKLGIKDNNNLETLE